MHIGLDLGERAGADGGPRAVEVVGDTGGDEGTGVGRPKERNVSGQSCWARVCGGLLLDGVDRSSKYGSELLHQMRPVARLLELLYYANDNIIVDAFRVDLVHTRRSRRRWRCLLDSSGWVMWSFRLDAYVGGLGWAHRAGRWWIRAMRLLWLLERTLIFLCNGARR